MQELLYLFRGVAFVWFIATVAWKLFKINSPYLVNGLTKVPVATNRGKFKDK